MGVDFRKCSRLEHLLLNLKIIGGQYYKKITEIGRLRPEKSRDKLILVFTKFSVGNKGCSMFSLAPLIFVVSLPRGASF